MTPRPISADPHEPLDRFIAETAWTHRHSTYPLIDDEGRLTGLVTLNRIRVALADRRAAVTLSDIACRPEELPITTRDEQLVDLLPRMTNCSDGRAVVVDERRRVIGIVSPSDISRAMQLRDLRPFDPYPGPRGGDLLAVSGSRS
jgi:predicted transcriptional regulator